MKFLAMHIINTKISFYIFMVINVQNIFMEHDLYLILKLFFGIKEKSIILIHTMYFWLLECIDTACKIITAYIMLWAWCLKKNIYIYNFILNVFIYKYEMLEKF